MWSRGLLLLRMSVFAILAALGLQLALGAESEEATSPEAAALVRKLGDDSYQVRARASGELAELGLKARHALEAGLKHPDAEVRRRCRWILQDVLEADYQRRLQAFVDDGEGKGQHDLPGWQRYRRIVGDDQPARKLFVEMQRAENGLLISAAAGSDAVADALKLRLGQVYRLLHHPDPKQRKVPPLATTAALLFVVSDPLLELPPELADNPYLATLVQQADFQKALTGGDDRSGARSLLGQWILRPTGPNLLHTKLRLAVQYDVKEGLELALRTVKDDQQPAAPFRAYAVVALGQLGGKPYAAMLAKLLDDRTECGRRVVNKVTTTIEIRDVALAWLIHLTGQSHAEYGLERAKAEFERMAKNRRHYMSYSYCGFDDKAKREAALKKWKAYVKANPLPDPPKQPPDEAPEESENKPAPKPAPKPAAKANAAAALGFGVPPVVKDGVQDQPPSAGPEAADRPQVRSLTLARRLCRTQRFTDAARLLDEILAAQSDHSFRPDKKVPLSRYLKPAAEQLIGHFPDKGREAYRLKFGARARQLLHRAVEAGDARALAEVAEQYFFTPAGAQATYLLALSRMNHGHPFHAALYLQRLQRRSWDADRFEPGLSATLAACWLRAGLPRTAEEVLLRMQARYPNATVRIGGEHRRVFARPEEALAWLESFVGPSGRGEADGWPMFRGDPARNLSAAVGVPFVQGKALTPVCDDPLLSQTVDKLRKEQHDQHQLALPKLHPLVVSDTILLRTATHLRALDFASGEVRWEAPLEDALRHFLQTSSEEQRKSLAESLSEGLKRRLWEDAVFGRLSSDGRHVFGVEDLSFGFRSDFQRMVVMPDGRRRLDPGSLKKYNLLVAYDVQTGKVKWEIGGPPDVAMAEQAGTYFHGPPLPLGRRLYAVAQIEQETRLLELDAETGRLVSDLTLTGPDEQTPIRARMFMPFGLSDGAPDPHGTSPSYADGVMVCGTPENHLVAVDLATRAVLWVYRVPLPEPPLRRNLMIALPRQLYQAGETDPSDRWADASVTIAEGRVLWTPRDTDELICLGLADGHLHWSAPRRDGLYVGGVDQGKVIVVGRGSVWAVNLADAAPAWPEPVRLPADALPSGRGFLGEGRYHLPLSTAEVAAIDLSQGRLSARSRSSDATVPGNLVPCREWVLSQNVDGLRRLEPLTARINQLAAASRRRPDDPQLLADYGQALLCVGQLVEAVEHLRRAMELKPTPRTRQMLSDAVLDGLRTDFDTFHKLAGQVAPLIDQTDEQARFLQQLAAALQRAGHVEAAWETYLRLIDLKRVDRKPERFAAARVVRRDRWIQARVAELRAAATTDQRAKLDQQIAYCLREDDLPAVLAYFGANPAAHQARLSLAKKLAHETRWLQAEQLLRHVLHQGDSGERRAAAAQLAELLRAANRPAEAARCYQYLARQLAETVCLDGRTGAELLEALPADDPVRQRLTAPDKWPSGKVHKEVSDRKSSIASRYPVAVVGESGPFDTDTSVEIDVSRRKLTGRDASGRARWQLSLGTDQPMPTVIWNFGVAVHGYAQGWLRGHLLIARLSDRVCAIDTLADKPQVLWNKKTLLSKQVVPGMPVFIGGMGIQMPRQPNALPGSDPLPLAVTDTCVCFQQNRELLCVDPLSGDVLWSRDDLHPGSDLFGDDELLFVTPPDSAEATVLSTLDGRLLGRRRVPPLKERVWTLGRKVLTWSRSPERACLVLFDPWAEQEGWRRGFHPKAQPWLLDAGELAVLDPEGHLAIIGLPEGETTLQTKVDPQPSLEGIVVLRSPERYVLIANDAGLRPQPKVFGEQIYPGHVPVYGRAYGLDRQTGKKLWQTEVRDQALKLDQPGELPVLTFFNRVRKMDGNRVKYQVSLLCLDKRTGRVLHRQTSSDNRPNLYEIEADRKSHSVQIRSYLGTVKLTFREESAEESS